MIHICSIFFIIIIILPASNTPIKNRALAIDAKFLLAAIAVATVPQRLQIIIKKVIRNQICTSTYNMRIPNQ